jgi:hypothetical protein
LLVDKKWDKMDSSEEQIITLTTQVKQLKKAALLKAKGNGSGNSTKKFGANTSGKSSIAGSAKGTIPSLGIKAKAPAWQITKAGATITHPDHRFDMVWCPEHVSKCGTVNGMYMKAPHDHAAWQKNRTDRSNAEKAAAKERDAVETQGGPSTKKSKGSDAKKLALVKSFTAALTTQFLCSEADAQQIVEKTFASARTTAVTISQKNRSGSARP